MLRNVNARVLASVLICTRNRAAALADTLQGVARQTLSSGQFEVIVVDNGSTDNTEAVVRRCQLKLKPLRLRYCLELEVGLSAARNRAMQESRGSVFCFLDDDAIPESGWIEWIVRGFAKSGPGVMAVGGAIIPAYEIELPVWFAENLSSTFSPQIRSAGLHRVLYPYYPYGANFAVRAEAVKHVGLFDITLGYKGKKLIPCEETEYLLRLENAGYEIMMEPRSIVRHVIPAGRLTKKWLLRRFYAQGRGDRLLACYCHRATGCDGSRGRRFGLRVVKGVWGLALCVLYCIRHIVHGTSQADAFLRQCLLAERIGYIFQSCLICDGARQPVKEERET